MLRIVFLLVFAATSSQPYDIAVGDAETFLVFGEGVQVYEDVGSVVIEDIDEIAPGMLAVRISCASSPTGRCTGTIGPS